MAITAAQVKELREMTGAGMMDCKKALTATEGDMDKAVEFLREKGLATAQKKANRVAAEGLCKTLVADDAKNAVVVEVNSETDFVAKNEKFQQYVADVAAQALTTTAADIDAFLAEAWALDTTKTVKEAIQCYDQWLKNTVNSEINKSDKPIGSSLRVLFSLGTRLHAQGKTLHLACWCKDELEPKPYDHACHCDVIKRVLLARFKKQSQT